MARLKRTGKSTRLQDLTGKQFGRLTVLSREPSLPPQYRTRWKCVCLCGNTKVIHGSSLKRGLTSSCGCLSKEVTKARSIIHGMHKSREFAIWKGIKNRCNNKNIKSYSIYGNRGIKVCKRWEDSFSSFYEDMGPRPSKNHSIDRIDNDGDYCPENCRWATRVEQANNRRTNKKFTHNGKTLNLEQWAKILGLTPVGLLHRFSLGWSIEEALSTPKITTRQNCKPGSRRDKIMKIQKNKPTQSN